ncbi:hypothetical protein BWQ96_09437 [Gracilariopsis chorda]|uniref:Uncharacterized protein n=1 Tax=Gracilariopsis chorda TaxID=448386 RepID=A0A2V3IFJ4_9FLOR|nr:hypothetical protein BWQ96_09437 [Gracilariopsis chorda]|eukprot:PXF40847.1 hypothetical protein BWQ96_09437 [Gracilariopsis chorda]
MVEKTQDAKNRIRGTDPAYDREQTHNPLALRYLVWNSKVVNWSKDLAPTCPHDLLCQTQFANLGLEAASRGDKLTCFFESTQYVKEAG